MKKLLLSLFAFGSLFSASAQFLNGNFEAAITNPQANFPNYSSTTGWGGGIYKKEQTNPGQALQSVKISNVIDAPLNTAFGNVFPTDTLPGFIIQTVDGPAATWQGATISFMYKNQAVGGDTSAFVVQIYDTLAAGATDDVILNEGYFQTTANVTTWTTTTMTLAPIQGATGTPNQIFIVGTSSVGALFGTKTPVSGNTFWLDDVKKLSGAGIDENIASSVKVYPNPTNDVLNIKADGEISNVTITTLDGKVVKSGSASTVNVSELTSGMYIYQVTVNGNVSTGNFVKN